MIKENIEKNGYHCIENFISADQLLRLKLEIDESLKKNDYQYFFLTAKNLEGSLINDIEFNSNIKNLMSKTLKEYNLIDREDEDLYKILRVVTGKKSKKVSLDYHFDAHLLTLLIPIMIPNRENSDNGNLIILKNLRKVHNNIFLNIIQKIFYQSLIFKKLLNFNLFNNIYKKEILNLKPGNIYIFNGFRTLHANLNINPEDVRATCLVHYYDIFKDSFLVKFNRSLRQKKELKNFKNDTRKN